MSTTIAKMNGFKATDKDMKCRGLQFELGKWYEVTGDLNMCENGFHFCQSMSGVWNYYNFESTRVFRIEAEEVIDPQEPGADNKCVCRRIRLVEEVVIGGDKNTGDGNTGNGNTGDRNTGDGNTGDRNTGDGNTGYGNTGDRNTGYRNTGYGNTGDGNTGDRNTGYGNTGDGNTGDRNTGYRNTGYGNTGYGNTGDGNTGDRNTGYGNTGDGNTGDRNTGDGNATDYCSGFLCINPQPVLCFDKPVDMSREDFMAEHGDMLDDLCRELMEDGEIDAEYYKSLPNWSKKAVKALHKAHKARRKNS